MVHVKYIFYHRVPESEVELFDRIFSPILPYNIKSKTHFKLSFLVLKTHRIFVAITGNVCLIPYIHEKQRNLFWQLGQDHTPCTTRIFLSITPRDCAGVDVIIWLKAHLCLTLILLQVNNTFSKYFFPQSQLPKII